MEFLTKTRCEEFITRVGLDPDTVMRLRRIDKKHAANFDYKSRLATMAQTCALIAEFYPNFSTALFWTSCSPWGDGSSEDDVPMRHRSEWKNITRLRESLGESRRLYDTPGHLFPAGERSAIATFAEAAIGMGWDSVLLARPNRTVVYFSHDDIVQIQSDKNLSEISTRLSKLGFKRRDFY